MGLIEALGLDWRIFLAQLFNFAILVWVLRRFAYQPVMKILEERRQKIDRGLSDSEAAALRLEEAEKENKKIILTARQEALGILEEARLKAEEAQKEIIAKAQEEIGEIMNKERAKIAAEKSQSLEQIKEELAALVLESLTKFLGENVNDARDQEIIAKIVNNLKKQ